MATSPAQPQSCPIKMEAGACGRSIHTVPQGIDDVPVCLMHSKDPVKHTGNPLYSKFFLAFKDILKTAGQGTADFTKFVFPYLSLRSTSIDPECRFHEAVFEEAVDLYEVEFKRNGVVHRSHFSEITFVFARHFQRGNTDFEFVKFCDGANFHGAIFHQSATFFGSEFNGIAIFLDAVFKDEAEFNSITFGRATNFEKATFEANVTFEQSTFNFPPFFWIPSSAQKPISPTLSSFWGRHSRGRNSSTTFFCRLNLHG